MSFGDPQATVVWWKSPQVLAALSGIAASIVAMLHALHVPFIYTTPEVTIVLTSLTTIGSLVYWIVRRVKDGRDPGNPAPTVTMTQKP